MNHNNDNLLKLLIIYSILFLTIDLLGCKEETLTIPDPLSKAVVDIRSDDYVCSGVRIKDKKGNYYILTAGHCRSIEIDKKLFLYENGEEIKELPIIAESEYSDLLLLEGNEGTTAKLADKWTVGELAFKLGFGNRRTLKRANGTLIESEPYDFPYNKHNLHNEVCPKMPKYVATKVSSGVLCNMTSKGLLANIKTIPGDSGGGLFNNKNELIGIISASLKDISDSVLLEDIKKFLKSRNIEV